ncbi:MAG: galactokinase family protein [Pseudomonadota bacterium]
MMSSDLNQFKQAAEAFQFNGRLFFNPEQKITFARSPGRLDVMGGIADYSGSLVLEMSIAEATFAAIQTHSEPALEIISQREDGDSYFQMPLAAFGTAHRPIPYVDGAAYFQKDPENRWASYVAGVFLVLMREKEATFSHGAKILIRSDVPEGKGVSSSAAIEVATMLAIAKAYSIDLDPIETAILSQMVENKVAGAPCGIMDQMTVVNGRKGQLMALLCQPATIEGYVDIPANFAFWGIDSGIRHAVSGADYGSVRVGAFMGLKILQSLGYKGDYLANLAPSEFEQHYRNKLPESLEGADFLEQYGELPDTVTTVEPERVYWMLAVWKT